MLRAAWFGVAICLTIGVYGQTTAPVHNGTMVMVPALVESKSGEIAYGLSADDFSIKDDGVQQRISLENDSDIKPISLLLVIQTGHNISPQLGKISRLPDLLDSILTNPQDQAAILTFDGSPRLLQGFTADQNAISAALSSVTPGNSGAALFDAMHLAIRSFEKAAPNSQEVIVLISGEHDHGSAASDTGSLIREIASTNISVYSISLRPGKREFFGKIRSLNPLGMAGNAMQKNAGQALADLTGGDFFRFDSERDFEDRMSDIARHIHNRYSLTFQPDNARPGLHSLEVEVQQSKVNVVAARSGYWASSEHNTGGSPE
jgi:VWFA-related protein